MYLTYTYSNENTNSYATDTLLITYIGVVFILAIAEFAFFQILPLRGLLWVIGILQALILILIPFSIKNKSIKIVGLIISLIILAYEILKFKALFLN